MAKKKQELTADEKVEQETLEANVVAQEAAEAAAEPDEAPDDVTPAEREARARRAISDAVQSGVVPDAVGTPEGAPKPDHVMPKPTFTLMEDGRYRENRFDHARTVTIDGQQYEHVAEDPDGRWIYARS